jgi:hypothetical protein
VVNKNILVLFSKCLINKGDLGGLEFFLSPNFNSNDNVYVNLDIDNDYNISVLIYRRC